MRERRGRQRSTSTATCKSSSEVGKRVVRLRSECGPEVSLILVTPCEFSAFFDANLSRMTVMSYTSDFMPHIGVVPDTPSQYILAGFSGHGMPQILLACKALAAMVIDDITYEQTGLPMMFKTTKERLSAPRSELEEGFKDIWASYASTANPCNAAGTDRLRARL